MLLKLSSLVHANAILLSSYYRLYLTPPLLIECHSYFLYPGAVDSATILEQVELQIAKVKEEAFSRKEILEKVEKWLMACDEECWLEEYNRVGAFIIS